MKLLIFLVLFISTFCFKVIDSNFKGIIEYSLSSSPTLWYKRGELLVNNNQKLIIKNDKLTKDTIKNIEYECSRGGEYIVKVTVNSFDFISNVDACSIINSEFNDVLYFSFLDENLTSENISSVSYMINESKQKNEINIDKSYQTRVKLLSSSKVMSINFNSDPNFKEPNTNTNQGQGQGQGQKGEKEEEQSIFRKYWWVILIVIFMLNKAPSGEEGKEKEKDN